MSPTVRLRTALLATLFVGLTLTLGAITLVRTLDHSLVRSSDGLDRARAQDLVTLASRGALPPVVPNIDDNGVAQVVDSTGRVLAASPNVVGAGPITTERPSVGDDPVVRTVRDAPDDNETETYRVWMLTARTPDGVVTAYAGTSLEAVPESSKVLRRVLWVGVPATVALIGLCTWLLVGRALRPVEAIRSRVAGISERRLDQRVPVPAADDEIRRLAVTMNGMLDRLDQAHRRQRDFVSDASHELQSPVAAIRTQLEVALAHPSGTDWQALAGDLLSDCGQMERLVRDLLFLARTDLTHDQAPRTWLDLDDLALEEVARAGGPIDASGVSAAPVLGNADELRRLIRNLLENGLRHAASRVTVTVAQRANEAVLTVADDGTGVPVEERERIFDRFHRGDTARDGAGTGLGLAIARSIAERHGGTLAVADSADGARFELRLPL